MCSGPPAGVAAVPETGCRHKSGPRCPGRAGSKLTSTGRAWLLRPSNQRARSSVPGEPAGPGMVRSANQVQPHGIGQGIAQRALLLHELAGQLVHAALEV